MIATGDRSRRRSADQQAQVLIGLVSALCQVAVEAKPARAIKQQAITGGLGQKLFGFSLLGIDHNAGIGKFAGSFQEQWFGLILVKDHISGDEICGDQAVSSVSEASRP